MNDSGRSKVNGIKSSERIRLHQVHNMLVQIVIDLHANKSLPILVQGLDNPLHKGIGQIGLAFLAMHCGQCLGIGNG